MNKILILYACFLTLLFGCLLWGSYNKISSLENAWAECQDSLRICQSVDSLRLDIASYYVNIVDSAVFVGMSENDLLKTFTIDGICLLYRWKCSDIENKKCYSCDYIYAMPYLGCYYVIKNQIVKGTINSWSNSYDKEIQYYIETIRKDREGGLSIAQ